MNTTVGEFDPAAPVRLTEAALRHLRQQIRSTTALGLRLTVKESGCTGYRYVLDLVQGEAPAGDLRVAVADDVVLWLDPQALDIVRGTTIDYAREGVNSTLRFLNPNVQDSCGCGESFNVTAGSGN